MQTAKFKSVLNAVAIIAVAAVLAFLFLAGEKNENTNTDPRLGSVKTDTGASKWCEGSTLRYSTGHAEPGHKDCKR